MEAAARQNFWKNGFDDSLAIVNNGTGYIETNFMLGDQMTLEVCFKKTSTVRTGYVFTGFYDGTDPTDFRFFFATNNMHCDCGKGNPPDGIGGVGGRYTANDEMTQWHIIKFPALVNGEPVATLDNAVMTKDHAYASNGAWGTTPSKLKLFGATATDTSYQPGAIRYINVWQYNTNNLLASFWPDKAGGVKDIISKKTYLPLKGSVEIVKWKDLGLNMNEG